MMPVRNRVRFIRQAVESVLRQDPGESAMEICLVDNSTSTVDFWAQLPAGARDRIRYFKQPTPVDLAENWNTCVRQARGHYVHILHDDDWVLPDFYAKFDEIARLHPTLGLIACRSFYVDEAGLISGLTERQPAFEQPCKDPRSLLAGANQLQTPAVVVRRDVYEQAGGFRRELCYGVDLEMWVRAIIHSGGVILPDILACYRVSADNITSEINRTGQGMRDFGVFRQVMLAQVPGWDSGTWDVWLSQWSQTQIRLFRSAGQHDAAATNIEAWKTVMPASFKRRYWFQSVVIRGLRPWLKKLGLHLGR
jgi:glycosyltransferase involved in cell wall biosynthesis